MRLRAFKYRIYPTKAQEALIAKHFGCCRFVYNWGLETKNKGFQEGKKLNIISVINMVPKLKDERPWLREVNAQSLQWALQSLDVAFTKFFRKEADFPRFKKRGKSRDSFSALQGCKVDQKNGRIFVRKIPGIKAVIHRPFEGELKRVTISKTRAGSYYASCQVETAEEDKPCKPIDPRTTIGIDMGLRTFCVVSDGRRFENPRTLSKSLDKIGFLDRQMRRKKRGGKNREKARLRLAREHEKVTRRRMDFLHKVSDALADESQVGTICVETLNVAGMLRNHSLARRIQDAAWGTLFGFLEYKCGWRGINFLRIGRFEPSSRMCTCGRINHALTLGDKEWTCPACGARHDRDDLAANNIRRFGLARGMTPQAALEKRRGDCPSKARGAARTGLLRRKTKKAGTER